VSMGKKFLVLLLVLSIITLLAGCSQEKDNSETKEAELLKIGVLPIEDIMPILVAENNGYFNQENIQVEIVRFQSAVEQINAMQSGQLDGMVTDMIVAGMIKDSGQDVRVTSITLGEVPEEGRFAILASSGSDIDSIEDLKGKSIGISYNSIIEYITDGILIDAGIDPSDVKKTSVPKIPLRMEMLFNNKIDAIVVPGPLITFAEFNGAKVVAEDTDTERNLSQAVVVFDKKVLDEKKSTVEAFYRAYEKAVDDLNNHPEDYKQLMIENVNIPEPIAEDYSIQHYPQPVVPAEEDVNNIINWMKEKDLLKNDLSYADLVQE
jgi:NitT/TauT family transport system substrate-binding protein